MLASLQPDYQINNHLTHVHNQAHNDVFAKINLMDVGMEERGGLQSTCKVVGIGIHDQHKAHSDLSSTPTSSFGTQGVSKLAQPHCEIHISQWAFELEKTNWTPSWITNEKGFPNSKWQQGHVKTSVFDAKNHQQTNQCNSFPTKQFHDPKSKQINGTPTVVFVFSGDQELGEKDCYESFCHPFVVLYQDQLFDCSPSTSRQCCQLGVSLPCKALTARAPVCEMRSGRNQRFTGQAYADCQRLAGEQNEKQRKKFAIPNQWPSSFSSSYSSSCFLPFLKGDTKVRSYQVQEIKVPNAAQTMELNFIRFIAIFYNQLPDFVGLVSVSQWKHSGSAVRLLNLRQCKTQMLPTFMHQAINTPGFMWLEDKFGPPFDVDQLLTSLGGETTANQVNLHDDMANSGWWKDCFSPWFGPQEGILHPLMDAFQRPWTPKSRKQPSQFLVSKGRIQSLPREFYIHLYEWCIQRPHFCRMAQQCLRYSWELIFATVKTTEFNSHLLDQFLPLQPPGRLAPNTNLETDLAVAPPTGFAPAFVPTHGAWERSVLLKPLEKGPRISAVYGSAYLKMDVTKTILEFWDPDTFTLTLPLETHPNILFGDPHFGVRKEILLLTNAQYWRFDENQKCNVQLIFDPDTHFLTTCHICNV